MFNEQIRSLTRIRELSFANFSSVSSSNESANEELLQLCISLIEAYFLNQHIVDSQLFVSKGISLASRKNPILSYELECLNGIINISRKRILNAAHAFTQNVPSDFDSSETGERRFKDLIPSEDIAIYGSLCALASFSRKELKANILQNYGFKTLLDLVPDMKEVVLDFYASKYSSCFKLLENMKQKLVFDMYIGDILPTIYDSIRRSALISYPKPFKCLDLRNMADVTFGIPLSALESELASLILQGLIHGRIDSENKVCFDKISLLSSHLILN